MSAKSKSRIMTVTPDEKKCSICGDTEPFHVHNGDKRIEDYFTVGRGMSDIEAARAWQERALAAERKLKRRGASAKFEGSRFLKAGPVTIGAMSPEARSLLDRALTEWKEFKKGLPKKVGGKRYVSGIYGFAYWLIRWSGLVRPARKS